MKIPTLIITAILTFYALVGFLPTLLLWIRYATQNDPLPWRRMATGFAIVALLISSVALCSGVLPLPHTVDLSGGFTDVKTHVCRVLAGSVYQLMAAVCVIPTMSA